MCGGNEADEIDDDTIFFSQLLGLFREHFSGRAEGTKKELEETIRFLCNDAKGEPILAHDTPLGALTSETLKQVRTAVMQSEVRLAKKNLHLTYLRMILHFGVKREVFRLNVNPADCLPWTIYSEGFESEF